MTDGLRMIVLGVGQGSFALVQEYAKGELSYLSLVDCGSDNSEEKRTSDNDLLDAAKRLMRERAIVARRNQLISDGTLYLDEIIISHRDKDHISLLTKQHMLRDIEESLDAVKFDGTNITISRTDIVGGTDIDDEAVAGDSEDIARTHTYMGIFSAGQKPCPECCKGLLFSYTGVDEAYGKYNLNAKQDLTINYVAAGKQNYNVKLSADMSSNFLLNGEVRYFGIYHECENKDNTTKSLLNLQWNTHDSLYFHYFIRLTTSPLMSPAKIGDAVEDVVGLSFAVAHGVDKRTFTSEVKLKRPNDIKEFYKCAYDTVIAETTKYVNEIIDPTIKTRVASDLDKASAMMLETFAFGSKSHDKWISPSAEDVLKRLLKTNADKINSNQVEKLLIGKCVVGGAYPKESTATASRVIKLIKGYCRGVEVYEAADNGFKPFTTKNCNHKLYIVRMPEMIYRCNAQGVATTEITSFSGATNLVGDENGRSTMAIYYYHNIVDCKMVDYKNVLPGDATLCSMFYYTEYAAKRIPTDAVNAPCNLVAPHHGSIVTCQAETLRNYIAGLNARCVLVSAGYQNKYGHPHNSFIDTAKKCLNAVSATAPPHSLVYNQTDNSSAAWKHEPLSAVPIYTCVQQQNVGGTMQYAFCHLVANGLAEVQSVFAKKATMSISRAAAERQERFGFVFEP